MKVAHVVPARNKIQNIKMCLDSLMAQTCHGAQLVVSDQCSTDGTDRFIKEYMSKYDGPNEVLLLNCPLNYEPGMSAFNMHINWIMSQLDADLVLITAADDVTYPDRTTKVAEAYQESGSAMIVTAQEFYDPQKGQMEGITGFSRDAGFLTGAEIIENHVGGSSSLAWSSEFFRKVGGCEGIIPFDVYLPFLAAQDDGCYWIPDILHCYINWADANNTGLGGVNRQNQIENKVDAQRQTSECMQYQITASLVELACKAGELYPETPQSDLMALFTELQKRAFMWVKERNYLTYAKVPPLPMRV